MRAEEFLIISEYIL